MSDITHYSESSENHQLQPFSTEVIISEEDKLGLIRTTEYFGGQLQVGCYLLLNKEGQPIVNVQGPIDRHDRRGVRTYSTGVIVAKINGQYVQITEKELALMNNVYGQVPQLRGRIPEVMQFIPGLSLTPEAVAAALKESQIASDMKMLPVTLQS